MAREETWSGHPCDLWASGSYQWVQKQSILVGKGYRYFMACFSSREILSTLRIRTPIPVICLSFRAPIFFSWLHHVLKMQPLSH